MIPMHNPHSAAQVSQGNDVSLVMFGSGHSRIKQFPSSNSSPAFTLRLTANASQEIWSGRDANAGQWCPAPAGSTMVVMLFDNTRYRYEPAFPWLKQPPLQANNCLLDKPAGGLRPSKKMGSEVQDT